MKITNTKTSYLMFLAYLDFTEFEILIMYCCCRPRFTSLFPKEALNKWIFRWKIHKDSSFFSFIFPSVLLFVLTFFRFFFFFGGGGGGGVVGGLRAKGIVVFPAWFPLQGYCQRILE